MRKVAETERFLMSHGSIAPPPLCTTNHALWLLQDIYNLMEQEEIPVAQEDHMAYLAGTMPNFQKLRGCIQVLVTSP